MLLLMPFLLLTTSVQKLVGLDLHVPPAAATLPPDPAGIVEDVVVEVVGSEIEVTASVRRTDVGADAGDVQQRVVELPPVEDDLDLGGLQATLRSLKTIDPDRKKVLLSPDDSVPGRDVVHLMDALRGDADGELYPEVALGGR